MAICESHIIAAEGLGMALRIWIVALLLLIAFTAQSRSAAPAEPLSKPLQLSLNGGDLLELESGPFARAVEGRARRTIITANEKTPLVLKSSGLEKGRRTVSAMVRLRPGEASAASSAVLSVA